MAELFLARQTGVAGFERVVAIKRILPHLTEDREFVQMFVNEAKLAAQITHPNVVQIYDFGAVLGTYYMAMEYVMGKSLAAVLAQGQALGKSIPVSAAVRITAAIAAGLDHANRGTTVSGAPLGIIHRDISPQNILIGYNGDVKLVDFGIAKAASSSTHTQTGVLKGKLAYLSPEQAWGKAVDHRSDLFALGIVLHEMLTGQRLFKAENEFTTLERVRSAEVAAPSAVKSGVPRELDAIVLKALAKNPDDRYPTGHTLEDALSGYLQHLSPPPSARDLSDYLRALFDRDIATDTAAYQQVTMVTRTTATPTGKRPAPAAPAEKTRTLATPASRQAVPRPASGGRGRAVAVGLGAAAVLALSAFGAWSVLKPPATEPPRMPLAAVPPTDPVIPDPRVQPARTVPSPPVEAAPSTPTVTLEFEAPSPQPVTERPSPAPPPKRVKKPTTAPRSTPAKALRQPSAATVNEARIVAPAPTPKPAVPHPLAVEGANVAEPVKPVAEARPPAPTPTQVQPERVLPRVPISTTPPPPEPTHDEAPLPLLP
jgi:tRNA A-37 threonylcarbamoyl transferase component Bud32